MVYYKGLNEILNGFDLLTPNFCIFFEINK